MYAMPFSPGDKEEGRFEFFKIKKYIYTILILPNGKTVQILLQSETRNITRKRLKRQDKEGQPLGHRTDQSLDIVHYKTNISIS